MHALLFISGFTDMRTGSIGCDTKLEVSMPSCSWKR